MDNGLERLAAEISPLERELLLGESEGWGSWMFEAISAGVSDMEDEAMKLAERLERESRRIFPERMRDGHAYNETADLLDRAAAALRAQQEKPR